ncbi:MAG: transcription termination/antitermination protein NusG [Planctomycetota bacterium]
MSDETNKLADDVAAEADGAALVGEEMDAPAEEAPSAEAMPAEDAPVQDVEPESAGDDLAEAESGAAESESEESDEQEAAVDESDEDESGSDAEESAADEAEADEEIADEGIESDGIEEEAEESDEIKMDWYILKVQSNREKSITAALKRKIAVEGLEEFFGDVVVPVEKVTEFKGGKKKVVNRKLYPGYIVVHMHINDDTWFAVRETSGIGDFTGSGGKPTPMLPSEVARIIQTEEEETEDAPKLNITFKVGDRVKVNDGNFESFEGEVSTIDEHSGHITVMINIFGRSTPVQLEYWQVELT